MSHELLVLVIFLIGAPVVFAAALDCVVLRDLIITRKNRRRRKSLP